MHETDTHLAERSLKKLLLNTPLTGKCKGFSSLLQVYRELMLQVI